ncbi:unnamed protein product [Lupinus luteus]|uniref:Uncharacterized protein n=1 Tax=Lupinus luteus TaxID=3873 RepID=A0AAV1WZT6_LUPLU
MNDVLSVVSCAMCISNSSKIKSDLLFALSMEYALGATSYALRETRVAEHGEELHIKKEAFVLLSGNGSKCNKRVHGVKPALAMKPVAQKVVETALSEQPAFFPYRNLSFSFQLCSSLQTKMEAASSSTPFLGIRQENQSQIAQHQGSQTAASTIVPQKKKKNHPGTACK